MHGQGLTSDNLKLSLVKYDKGSLIRSSYQLVEYPAIAKAPMIICVFKYYVCIIGVYKDK